MPDRRADVYSLAVVAYEMLAGKRPFVASDPVKILVRKLKHDPPSLFEGSGNIFSARLEQVIARGLARDPEQRYGTAGEFAMAFTKAVDSPVLRALAEPSSMPRAENAAELDRALQETGPLDLNEAAAAPGVQPVPAERAQAAVAAPETSDATVRVADSRAKAQTANLSSRAALGIGGGALAATLLAAIAYLRSPAPAARVPPRPASAPTRAQPATPAPAPDRASGATAASKSQPPVVPAATAPDVGEPLARAPSELEPRLPEPTPRPVRTIRSPALAKELTRRGVDALAEERPKAATRHLRAAVQADSRYAKAWRMLGLVHERTGKDELARIAYQRYLKLAPEGRYAGTTRKRLQALSP